MAVKALKWTQVNAWRMAQHGLYPRLGHQQMIQAARRTSGVQAQVMSAAELALGARVDGLTPHDVQFALWQERTLVKTWAMRGTLHLIAACDLPLYVAARSVYDNRNWIGYFKYFGISQSLYETFVTAAAQILSTEPVTREALAEAISAQTGSTELHQLILTKGWGTPLKPLAWRGDLCFGPSQGQSVTFVHAGKWIGSWQAWEVHAALQEVARRYLQAYGPATPEDFARWWWGGGGLVTAKKLFASLKTELEEVDVEGWRGLALTETIEPLQKLEISGVVRLLPLFDAYVLGLGRGRALEPLLPQAYQSLVYRPQGWISAVVLVDGCMQGVWEFKNRGAQTVIKVRMFATPSAAVMQGIEKEVERIGAFLQTPVTVEFE